MGTRKKHVLDTLHCTNSSISKHRGLLDEKDCGSPPSGRKDWSADIVALEG